MEPMVRKAARAATPMFHRTETTSASRDGFSLMEVLVVLAIFALSTALILPSMSRVLDQTMAHAVFFEFQRQVSDLRREANRTGLDIRVRDPSVELPSEISDSSMRGLRLREPWTYTLVPELDIEAGGRCSTGSANLINQGRVVMTLRTEDGKCGFIRYHPDPDNVAPG